MTASNRIIWLLATWMSLASASPAVSQPSGDTEIRKVREVVQGIVAADNARDLAKVMSCYADDAVLFPPNESAVRGKAAIKPRYEAMFAALNPEIVGSIDEVQIGGEWAFVTGMNRGRMVPRAGGTVRNLNDAYVMVLKRQSDGSWKIARLMWHPAGAIPGK